HNDALRLLHLDDVQHLLPVDRLEIKLVGHVEVRGDRLRVAVHHERLVACLPGGEDTVHARVVELDTLPDPARAAAEDEDLLFIRDDALVVLLVRGVIVWWLGGKLPGTGIYEAI